MRVSEKFLTAIASYDPLDDVTPVLFFHRISDIITETHSLNFYKTLYGGILKIAIVLQIDSNREFQKSNNSISHHSRNSNAFIVNNLDKDDFVRSNLIVLISLTRRTHGLMAMVVPVQQLIISTNVFKQIVKRKQ